MYKKRIILLVSLIIGFIIFSFVFQQVGINGVVKIFSLFTLTKFLIILAAFFLIILVIPVLRWNFILKSAGYNIHFFKLFLSKSADYCVSYVTPLSKLGGEPVRAYILQKESNVPFVEGMGTIISDKVVEFTSALFLIIIGSFFIFSRYTLSRNVFYTFLFTLIFLVIVAYFFYTKTLLKKGFFTSLIKFFRINKLKSMGKTNAKIEQMENVISNFFLHKKKYVIMAFATSIFDYIFALFVYKLLASFLGINVNFLQALLIFVFVNIASVAPIPGALGTLEGSAVLVFLLIGSSAQVGAVFSLIVRIIELIFTGLGALIASFFGIKHFFLGKNGNDADNNKRKKRARRSIRR